LPRASKGKRILMKSSSARRRIVSSQAYLRMKTGDSRNSKV